MNDLSVLVVEDSVYSADLNIRELKKGGYTVQYRIVSGGHSMKAALDESKWDLIISDNSMPDFSALKALELRNKADTNIPFIIVSEDISMSEIDKAFEAGCSAFVAKERLTELRRIITEVLMDKSAGIRIGI
jgi:CheY-like chemotaxis protein